MGCFQAQMRAEKNVKEPRVRVSAKGAGCTRLQDLTPETRLSRRGRRKKCSLPFGGASEG